MIQLFKLTNEYGKRSKDFGKEMGRILGNRRINSGKKNIAHVAQLGERNFRKVEVVGPNPTIGSGEVAQW